MTAKRFHNRTIETMTREELMRYQWRLLQEQIRYAYAHSGLCQRQFAKAKITPDDIKTQEDFTYKVPFTTKQDLLEDQNIQPPFGTRLAIAEKDIYITYLTTGTTGKGQEVHTDTREGWDLIVDFVANNFTWAGWEKGDQAMNILPLGMTEAAPGIYMAMLQKGCSVYNMGMYDTKTKLEYMKRFHITNMDVTPTYLETLTYEAEKLGIDPARDLSVGKIMISMAAWPVSFIQKMEEKWQAKLYDNYGTTQGAEGCTCEKGAVSNGQRGFYHLYEYYSVHEVINPQTGEPVGPGEEGEMVATPLRKMGSPFLRFRLGDKVRYFPHDACDCGRPFALLEAGTIARYDDMIKIKGVSIWPQAIDNIVLDRNETIEYQGRVYLTEDKREEADITIEFKESVPAEVRQRLLSRISSEIRDTTGVRFGVKEATGQLPRYIAKASSLRWTDERIKGLERKRMA
ncbi:MAG: AMP-binding protein [Chloroflexi bacterium]|nr:AMP-binding protein [Chloroflexota bacterium]